MTYGIDDPFLRIGHDERGRAASALRRAGGEGRLTPAELDERIARAEASRTRGELAGVLEDVMPQLAVAELVSGTPSRTQVGPGFSWDDPLVVTAKWEDEKRLGLWDVPPFLEAHPVLSSVKLNFTAATPVSLVIDIVLRGRSGNLVLVVPDDWAVDTSRVKKGLGSIRNHVAPRANPGSPRIVVRGENMLGNLVARYPTRFDAWQQARALERQRPRALGR